MPACLHAARLHACIQTRTHVDDRHASTYVCVHTYVHGFIHACMRECVHTYISAYVDHVTGAGAKS